MSAYILIKVRGYNQDDPLIYDTGFPIHVSDKPQLKGKQVPPYFVQAEITDAVKDDLIPYLRSWKREIDWEFVGHDYAIDGHRLRVFVKPELVSISGVNGLTRTQVENFLNRWGAEVVSTSPNEVIFDVTIYNAAISTAFWDKELVLIAFTEKAYHSTTGIHQIEANYSSDPDISALSKMQIDSFIASRGGVIINHPTNKVNFEISRETIFATFKEDVRQKTDTIYSPRKFYFDPADVQLALDNGGSIAITRQQLVNRIRYRLDS